jgi:hypothetical protein
MGLDQPVEQGFLFAASHLARGSETQLALSPFPEPPMTDHEIALVLPDNTDIELLAEGVEVARDQSSMISSDPTTSKS